MTEADQLRTLRWLAERQGHASALYDSDLMVALGMSEEQVQSILLSLQARGEVEFRNMVLQHGHSLGRLRIRKGGLQRLDQHAQERARASDAAGRPRGLRRIVHWFASGRSR